MTSEKYIKTETKQRATAIKAGESRNLPTIMAEFIKATEHIVDAIFGSDEALDILTGKDELQH